MVDEDLRIMRIRTKTEGAVSQDDMAQEWEKAQKSLKTFNFERALKSDLIVLTNTDDVVTTVISPSSISRHRGKHGDRYQLNGEPIIYDLIGQPDPAPNDARNPVSYNWK